MTTFMVERDLKGIAMTDLAAAQQLAIKKSKEFTGAGTSIADGVISAWVVIGVAA